LWFSLWGARHHDDPFIQELIDRFESQGYHAYFGIIEIIAKEDGYELSGKLSIKPIYLKRKLRISVKRLQEIYSFCSTYTAQKDGNIKAKPKLMFNSSQEYWHFDFPKILKIKDNYAKGLQVPSKKVSLEEDKDKDKEGEEDEEIEKEVEKKMKINSDRCTDVEKFSNMLAKKWKV